MNLLFEALLDIKRLAGKADDTSHDPYLLLELIADRVRAAITEELGGAE